MDNTNYQGLYTAYLQMYYEARRNAGTGGGGKRPSYVKDIRDSQPVGHIQDKSKGTIHTGVDALKKSAAAEKKQMAKDKASADEKRRERARQNKDNKAKSRIDDLLKDIRGK